MEWISVKDRLPENKQAIIICNYDRRYYPEFAFFHKLRNPKFWDEYDNPLAATHWMPLPEPPKV